MINLPRRAANQERRRRWPTPWVVAVCAVLFAAFGGTAVAANNLIHAGDIAAGAVTGKAIRDGEVKPKDLSTSTRALLQAGGGLTGAQGDAGSPGAPGANGPSGANGANGANGPSGVDGANGVDGTNGTDGIDGTDGTVAPLSARQGLTALPTASPPTTVVALAVPAGTYVVLAKTQLSHTGAGDSIDCTLKSGATTIDQVSMKTLPALAAIPVPLQAVTTTASPSQLSVECKVAVANGSADFSSLIAIPTG